MGSLPSPGAASRGGIRWGLSLGISAFLVWYLLRQVDPVELWEIFRRLHWPSIGIYLLLSLAGLLCRSGRYYLILAGQAGYWPLLLATLIRNMFVDLLPARIGSLSFVYIATQRLGVPLQEGLAAFLLAFVFDFLALAPLLALALLVVGGGLGGGWVVMAITGGALTLLSLLAYLALIPSLELAHRVSSRLQILSSAREKLRETAASLRRVRARGVLGWVFGISVGVRLFKFSAYYTLLHGVLVSRGYTLSTLHPLKVFLGVVGAEMSATLPIHSLAGLGTWEAAWTLGFTQLGFSKEIAILSGFATHLLSQIHEYGLGLAAFLWVMRPGFRAKHSS